MAPPQQAIQRDPRYPVPPGVDALVEFHYPNPHGRRLSTSLAELCVAGLAFVVDHELPLVVRGARIESVVVRLGDAELGGKLLIRHATEDDRGRFVYGAIFYPSTEHDQLKLNGILTGMAYAS